MHAWLDNMEIWYSGFVFPRIKQEQIQAKIGPWADNKPKLI
jgi:hypothetical protein